MKRRNLDQTINTLANVDVIAGIVFLAIEIRQYTTSLDARSQTSAETPSFFGNEFLRAAMLVHQQRLIDAVRGNRHCTRFRAHDPAFFPEIPQVEIEHFMWTAGQAAQFDRPDAGLMCIALALGVEHRQNALLNHAVFVKVVVVACFLDQAPLII